MSTSVIRHLMNFFKERGIFGPLDKIILLGLFQSDMFVTIANNMAIMVCGAHASFYTQKKKFKKKKDTYYLLALRIKKTIIYCMSVSLYQLTQL